ncbi:hypothetical protein HY732_03700 [Candidatus Uhrbacteria bacterium]|nr:hypothetical protein [Candidatus Uhrbacteria bacterium]
MKILRTRSFEREFIKLPSAIRERFVQKLGSFLSDPFHPSLRSKKMQGRIDIWEVSITMNYRFTFDRDGGVIHLRRISIHDILSWSTSDVDHI